LSRRIIASGLAASTEADRHREDERERLLQAPAGEAIKANGELLDGDVVGDFEGEQEIVRHLGHHVLNAAAIGETGIRGVNANCLEGLGVLN
jgi:hypothetical protein